MKKLPKLTFPFAGIFQLKRGRKQSNMLKE
jgi:hypothetical protein